MMIRQEIFHHHLLSWIFISLVLNRLEIGKHEKLKIIFLSIYFIRSASPPVIHFRAFFRLEKIQFAYCFDDPHFSAFLAP